VQNCVTCSRVENPGTTTTTPLTNPICGSCVTGMSLRRRDAGPHLCEKGVGQYLFLVGRSDHRDPGQRPGRGRSRGVQACARLQFGGEVASQQGRRRAGRRRLHRGELPPIGNAAEDRAQDAGAREEGHRQAGGQVQGESPMQEGCRA